MLIITPDGGYLHIPHDLLLSTPAAYLSAQYGLTPEWITFAQQLAQGDVVQAPEPTPVRRTSKPKPRPFKRKRSPWAPRARDHRKKRSSRDHRER